MLPIIVGISFFISAVAIEMMKTSATPSPSVTFDIEAHSLSFTSLYFWIIPVAILTSLVGVSQTTEATPRILQRFEKDCYTLESDQEAKITLMNDLASRHDLRVRNGGLYSWQPGRTHHRVFQTAIFEHHHYTSEPTVQRRSVRWLRLSLLRVWPLIYYVIPVFIVLGAAMTGHAMTMSVPPIGVGCRSRGVLQIFFVWFGSYLLSLIPFGPHHKAQFWCTFIKDAICAVSTVAIVTATEFGVYNRCSCYTLFGQTGLALPEMPEVARILERGLQRKYPLIITMGILLQLIFIPGLVMLRYNLSAQVYMLRDDGQSILAWWYRIRWWPLVRRSHDSHVARCESETTIEEDSGDPGGFLGERQVHDGMLQDDMKDDKQDIEHCWPWLSNM
jgi:hypothetical protein